MSKLPGGWRGIHRRNWATRWAPDVEIVPSAWDKLLRELQLTDAQALELLADRRHKAARRITTFVLRNKEKKFVPECVLSRLGEATW